MWETIFIRMLRRLLREGTMIVHLPSGKIANFGDNTGTPVTVKLSDPQVLRRFITSPELSIGEAYMDGSLTIEGDDLYGFLTMGLQNLAVRQRFGFEGVFSPVLRKLKHSNPLGRAKKNVAHHYDLSGELFDLFLDADRQYSCAYFRTSSDTLDVAQEQKKAHIAAKLCLRPGLRVLDIGCGWGGMALTLARDYGVDVVGVTLSEEQHKTARQRVKAAGLEDRVDIRLADYREVREDFDRVVSVGMFEHVGVRHYREFFHHVRERLVEDGVALIHTIGRNAPPGRTSPWIEKYIFPGGYVPSLSEISSAIEKEALSVTDLEVWRLHYAETLKHWHARFVANIDQVRTLFDERFCRMWRFYLVVAEMSFRLGIQVIYQVQLTRGQSTVPQTRDYIYSGDRQTD